MIRLFSLLLLTLAPACLRAQTVWPSIEIIDARMKTHRGSFVVVTADSLTVQTAAGQATLQRNTIARVSRRLPGAKRRQILLGAAVGGGAALAIGAIADRRFANEGRNHLAKAILTPIGVGAGAALGAASGGWETVYRAKAIARPTP